MSIIKKILIFIIIVIVGAYLYGKFVFDVNDYRDDITSYLSERIGYEVIYKGKINIEFDPTATITVTDIYISDSSKDNLMIADIEKLELNIDKEKIINGVIDVERAEITNMNFYGVNIDEILMKSYTLIKDQKYKQFNSQNFTSIEFMRAEAVISKQLMKIDNINIISSLLSINGSGTVDMKSKNVNFEMIGTLKEKNDVTEVYQNNYPVELYNNNIPVKITGPVDKVDFSVDLTDIITKQIINPIKEKIIDELEEKILEQIKLPF